MSNRYAIHLETPSGLQFDGMVEADSLNEAAMKWARDIDYEAGKACVGIAVQDPNYNEEGKLRFSALSAGDISDVYGATECIYVASEFDPKALFREMAVHYEKPAEKREEFTVQSLKDAVDKLKAHAIKPDKDGYYRWRVDAAGNIELVPEAEKQELGPIDKPEVSSIGMTDLERAEMKLLNHIDARIGAANEDESKRAFLIARADIVRTFSKMFRPKSEASEPEKQEPEPIDHDFTAAKEVRPVESTLLRIWLAKDESNLNKQMDGMSGNWPGVGGPYCFDVEIGDGDATIVGGDPDPLYRGEIAAVSKTNKHGAGIRIRRDAQDDYIYIFPSISAYPKEDVGEEWTVDSLKLAFDVEDILFDIDDEMAEHVVRIVNKRRKACREPADEQP